jgi:hypothetical protein
MKLLATVVASAIAVSAAGVAPAQAAGTHFLLEGDFGVGTTDAAVATYVAGGTLGYGGKFRGFPVIFYLVADYSRSAAQDELTSSVSLAERSSSQDVLAFGPRLYIPVARNVRVFLQGSIGFAWVQSDWVVNDIEKYSAQDSRLATEVSGGIQARLAPWLSLGAGVQRMSFWGDEPDQSAAAFAGFSQGLDDSDQIRCIGMLAIHF